MLNRLAPVLLAALLLATGIASLVTGLFHSGSAIGTFMTLIGLVIGSGSLAVLVLAGNSRYG